MASAAQLDLFRPTQLILPNPKFEQRNEYKKEPKVECKPYTIPMCTIHPGQLNLYSEIVWHPRNPVHRLSDNSEKTPGRVYEHLLNSSRSAKGHVSSIAKRKMTKALNYMLMVSNQKTVHNIYSGRMFQFKIAFVTLTLPSKQIHNDNVIKSKCLNQLLIELRQKYHVKNYIWRAEKQKNGNLHFHILVDKFIPYQELRDRWNRIVNKLGYVDSYRNNQMDFFKDGFRLRKNLLPTWSAKAQKQAFERGAKTHWNSPNTTDIHSVRNIHNVKNYILKYITKNEIKMFALKIEKLKELRSADRDNIKKVPSSERKQLIRQKRNRQLTAKRMKQSGRIWGCNVELSNLKGGQTTLDDNIIQEIKQIQELNTTKIIKDTYFSVIFFDMSVIMQNPESQLFKLFSKFIFHRFNYSFQTELAA